jgi:hypothetical protein
MTLDQPIDPKRAGVNREFGAWTLLLNHVTNREVYLATGAATIDVACQRARSWMVSQAACGSQTIDMMRK